jgi:hypothetical protein
MDGDGNSRWSGVWGEQRGGQRPPLLERLGTSYSSGRIEFPETRDDRNRHRRYPFIRRNPRSFSFLVAPPPRHGARRGRGPRAAPRHGPSSARGISFLRETNRRGAGSAAREGDRPPGPQAREREAHARRAGEAPRLRPREDVRGRLGPRLRPVGHALAHAHGPCHGGGGDSRDGGIHVAGAGAREARRQEDGRLGFRVRALRDADGEEGLRRRDGERHARCGPHEGTRLGGSAGGNTGEGQRHS